MAQHSRLLCWIGLAAGAVIGGVSLARRARLRAAIDLVTLRGRRDLHALYDTVFPSDAVCRIDHDGRIVNANRRMRSLFRPILIDQRPFDALFDAETGRFIVDAIRGGARFGRRVRDVRLNTADGPQELRLEIGPVMARGRHTGFYGRMSDVRQLLEQDAHMREALQHIFDAAPVGIGMINAELRVTYANPKALEILGGESMEGRSIWEIVPDAESRAIVERELARRQVGEPSDYDLTIARLNDGLPVGIHVTALPQMDEEGRFCGSFVLMQSSTEEQVRDAMHRHIETIETLSHPKQLLEAVMAELRKLVPFDEYVVSGYAAHHRESRILYSSRPWTARRWWTMTDAAAESSREPRISDLDVFLTDPRFGYLKNEPGLQEFIDAGVKSFIYRPILGGGRVVASVSFLSMSSSRFDARHEAMLARLPLDAAVLVALHARERDDLQFRLDLVKELASASNNIATVAQVLVEKLAHQYEWSNVALFRVDTARGTARLLAQNADSPARTLPPSYEQPLSLGVVGHVASTGQPVNVDDVRTDGPFKQVFHASIPETVSELCIPITVRGRVRWLLNLEDVRAFAFARSEMNDIETITGEVAELLYRASTLHFLNKVVDHASDAVIVTNAQDRIVRTNEAARTLLGRSDEDSLDRALAEFLPGLRELPAGDPSIATATMTVTRPDHTATEVTLSASALPEDLGGRVFVLKDLSLQRRIQELEGLRQTYYQVALQTKTPLSLALTWVRRLASHGNGVRDLADRTIRQLRKVELTYDRLVIQSRCDDAEEIPYNEVLLTADEVLAGVVDQLPKADVQRIVVKRAHDVPPLHGDVVQLEFCVATILAYLLRVAAEEGQIAVTISADDTAVAIDIAGDVPGLATTGTTVDRRLSKAITDVALGEAIIRAFVERHHGSYERRQESARDEFRIELPAARRQS